MRKKGKEVEEIGTGQQTPHKPKSQILAVSVLRLDAPPKRTVGPSLIAKKTVHIFFLDAQ